MDMDNILNLISKLDKRERPKKVVGKATDELIALFGRKEEMADEIKEDMDIRSRQLALEAERKIKKEFAQRIKEHDEIHKKLWETVYKIYGLDPSKQYGYNPLKQTFHQYIEESEYFRLDDEGGVH